MRSSSCLIASHLFVAACSAGEPPPNSSGSDQASASASASASSGAPEAAPVVVSIVGTNDLHGRIQALPLLAGYVANLRAARAKDGGGVLLLDGGDMFQGTLESNLLEGAPIRDAYAKLGYAAVTVGNHEFDYGPLGPHIIAEQPGEDPRGALLALARDAPFPFLSANLLAKDSRKRVDWPNIPAAVTVTVAGQRVGLIGVTTEETLRTTIAPNVADLAMAPLAASVEREAAALRRDGAVAVVVLAHAGGKCASFHHDPVGDKCELDSEVWRLVEALPAGAVDVVVAGHTHAGVAHEVHGTAIIEQFSYGRAFGRVDLTLRGGRVVDKKIEAPRELCPDQKSPDFASCEAGSYEGQPVVRDADVAAVIAPSIKNAEAKKSALVGTTLEGDIRRKHAEESALGNLFADLMLSGTRGADVALMNGGGLRADLPKGPLAYGKLFEAFPFDNRIAKARMKVRTLAAVLRHNLEVDSGILSVAGVTLEARCEGGKLSVTLFRRGQKKPLADDAELNVIGSDFLYLGGDAFWGDVEKPSFEIAPDLMRDVMEAELAKRPKLGEADVLNKDRPRLKLPSTRPIRCAP